MVLKTEYESVSLTSIKRARNEWLREGREGADKVEMMIMTGAAALALDATP